MNFLPLALLATTCLCAAPGHRRTWALGQYSWVKLERAEAGAPASAQPCAVPRAALGAILASLTTQVGADREPLFLAEEAARLAEPMAEALAVADPGEDLIFMSTVKRGGGFMAPRLTVTGRMFVLEGRLNVIIQETRLEYDGRVRANDAPPLPGNGQRLRPGAAVISAAGAVALRGDWLAFPLEAAMQAVQAGGEPTATASGALPGAVQVGGKQTVPAGSAGSGASAASTASRASGSSTASAATAGSTPSGASGSSTASAATAGSTASGASGSSTPSTATGGSTPSTPSAGSAASKATKPASAPAAPPAAAKPAAPAQPPANAASPEERLRVIKRLREQNLLTEEEYQKKRQEIIKEL